MSNLNPQFAGYSWLIEHHRLNVLPNWHSSSIGRSGGLSSSMQDGTEHAVYPISYRPGDSSMEHLEFALKYDGINLGILSALFEVISQHDLASWIATKPTGKYARKIWFLYEFLTGRLLPLPDTAQGNYVELLEPDRYYTITPGRRVRRQRIVNNLLGDAAFCPMVRRTAVLAGMDDNDIRLRCDNITASYPADVLRRALSYLYNKETKSSFEIERVTPGTTRTERFINLLESAGQKDFCEKALLLDVQNHIVDPRFRDTDYRSSQNYIGQTVSFQRQLVHYVCPKPGDVADLMDGLILSHQTMKHADLPAIIHATVVSYGLVFIHPFEDGNGRLHRFLIHNVLSLRGVVPEGLMFPVSAAMLKHPAQYDRSLEAFSNELMPLLDYELSDTGEMRVSGDTARLYRYIDMTVQAESLLEFVTLTLEQELTEELDFLVNYDRSRKNLQAVVDMPDRLVDLFIRLCLQNNGRLSSRKRETHFSFLTDGELTDLELAVQDGFGLK
jgi:hypothetical protein